MLVGVAAHVAHIASEAAILAEGFAIRIDLRPVVTCSWGWLVLSWYRPGAGQCSCQQQHALQLGGNPVVLSEKACCGHVHLSVNVPRADCSWGTWRGRVGARQAQQWDRRTGAFTAGQGLPESS